MHQSTNYQILHQLLSRYQRPSEELMDALMKYVVARTYDAKAIFIHQLEVQQCISLVIDGAAIALKKKDNKKSVANVWRAGELILNAGSTVHGNKSAVEIIFLCDSKTVEIPTKALYLIRGQLPEMARYFDQFLATDIQKLEDYIWWLHNTKSKQRIKDFEEQYPLHHYYMPIGQKAGYLNMSERWYQEQQK